MEDMLTYNATMELLVKIQYTREEAEAMVKRHQSLSQPGIQCQCLECLYARNIVAKAQEDPPRRH